MERFDAIVLGAGGAGATIADLALADGHRVAMVDRDPYGSTCLNTGCEYALALADCWNERIEDWTYVRDTPLSPRFGVDGDYVRIAGPPRAGGVDAEMAIPNRGGLAIRAHEVVGLEFAYRARLGLRDSRDVRIKNTVAVVEGTIRCETPAGPGYYRYNGDGYGEHADGSPFDGQGMGRIWPLLTGERGHLALLQGEDPLPYVRGMNAMTGRWGLIPEQIWDAEPVPQRGLYPGGPTGSAMPLVWAHAELLKLLAAKSDGRPVELLDVVRERYGGRAPHAAIWYWRDEVPFSALPLGRGLVVEDRSPFVVHLSLDGWEHVEDRLAEPLGLGMFGLRLGPHDLHSASEMLFTRSYPARRQCEGRDHLIELGGGGVPMRSGLTAAPSA